MKMKQIKLGILMMVSLIYSAGAFSQTIEEGKRFLYYERYKSASETFNKMLTANPNNPEAAYYLGQAMILSDDRTAKDLSEAKILYQSKLAASPNSALLMAGIGHIELIEGKTQDARNHFEAAISLTQGKDIQVLNAVGFANGNPDSKNGDANYAIEKLKMATQVKKFNDANVLVNLGDAYRKAGDGGNAIQAYQQALTLDPKLARANYRAGRIYQSQGKGQEPLFMDYYNKAIAQDPAYAPVYNTLFNYYYETNVPKAAEYFEKYLAVSDNDPKACYYRASIKYAQGLFQEAITKADECIAQEGANPYPNLYGLKALAYNRLNDSVQAKNNYELYFNKQDPEKIGSGDLTQYASLLLKFPGNEEKAGQLIDRAVAKDSIETNKVNYLKIMAKTYDGQKNYLKAAYWYSKILTVKQNPGKTDLYYAGYGYYRGAAYEQSINVFNQYIAKYPEDVFGYYMVGKSNAAIDTTGELGLAVPSYEKVIELAEKEVDKTKVKDQLMGSYKYFIEYYYNVKKDQAKALEYVDKGIALDPLDTQLVANRELISKNDPKAAPPRKAAPPKQPAKP
jgi:tetratricopeptide (TPR) repeat protein